MCTCSFFSSWLTNVDFFFRDKSWELHMFHNISQPLWIDGKKTMEHEFKPAAMKNQPKQLLVATAIFFASPGIDLHQVPSVPLPLWPREAHVYVEKKTILRWGQLTRTFIAYYVSKCFYIICWRCSRPLFIFFLCSWSNSWSMLIYTRMFQVFFIIPVL